ncbi:hypothetical protein QBC46DRAFT_267794, partial [Diplogelasinospora grovesii]
RRKWRKEGRCIRCGSSDHWSRTCLSPKKVKINTVAFAQGGERSTRSGDNDYDYSSEDD